MILISQCGIQQGGVVFVGLIFVDCAVCFYFQGVCIALVSACILLLDCFYSLVPSI